MRRFLIAAALLAAAPAVAQAGAWPVTHAWNETARKGDPTSGSYAWEYGIEAAQQSADFTTRGVKYDCADLAITLLVEYAARNGLPVSFSTFTTTYSSTDARFTSVDQFATYARSTLNAKMLAFQNTQSIAAIDLRPGDLYLMRWNQLPVNPFGPGTDVWHTYVVGEPYRLLFYGNEGDHGEPVAIVATAESWRLAEVQGQAVYQSAPRRWKLLANAIVPPPVLPANVPSILAPKKAIVNTAGLNVRAAPGMTGKILAVAKQGETFSYEGSMGTWARVRRNGALVFMSSTYLKIETDTVKFAVMGDWGTPPPVVLPATIELPAANARVSLPLKTIVRAGEPGQKVILTLRWKDGTEVSKMFPALRGEDGHGVVVAQLDFSQEGPPPAPPTQEAKFIVTDRTGRKLAEQTVTVVAETTTTNLGFFDPMGAPCLRARRILPAQNVAAVALDELLWGPEPRDMSGSTSALPTPAEVLGFQGRGAGWGLRAKLLSVKVLNGVATADFSRELAAYGGDAARAAKIKDQIARTLGMPAKVTIEGTALP